MNKLSIITINKNNASGLHKTIESVVSQTFTDYEYIIIDGASIDGSVDVIKEYADKISYWVSEPDNGIYNALNKGILKANGEYLFFLNSGDHLFDKDTLNNIFTDERDSDILYGNVLAFDDKKTWEMKYPKELSLSFFISGGNICHQGLFTKRNTLIELGSYDENYKICADYDSYIKAILSNKTFDYIDGFVSYYSHDGISSTNRIILNEEFNCSIQKNISKLILHDYNELLKLKFELEFYKKSTFYRLRTKNKIYRKIITLFLLILNRLDLIITKIWNICL